MSNEQTLKQPEKPATTNLVAVNPFFIVDDFQAAVSYYIDRLGFQLDFQGPDDDQAFYGRVSRDGVAPG